MNNTSLNQPSSTLPPLKLSKEARKFFTRLIYKKCLFAKVVSLNNSLFNIVLGVQTQRGIIDVYMHLLSKFDRKRYELIRNIQHIQQTQQYLIESPPINREQQFLAANGGLNTKNPLNCTSKKKQFSKEAIYVNEPLPTENIYYNDLVNGDEYDETSSSAFESELYLNAIAQTNKVPLAVVGEDSESSNYEYDDHFEDDSNDETDYALFSDIMSYFNNNSNFNINTSRDLMQDSMSTFSISNDEHSLDYTPVKGDTNSNQSNKPVSKKLNYAPLKIDSIKLPPLNANINANSTNEIGTALAANRKRFAPRINSDSNSTPILTRPTGGTSPFKNINHHLSRNNGANFNNNYSSDTDSSIHAACCSVNPLKMKWLENRKYSIYPISVTVPYITDRQYRATLH